MTLLHVLLHIMHFVNTYWTFTNDNIRLIKSLLFEYEEHQNDEEEGFYLFSFALSNNILTRQDCITTTSESFKFTQFLQHHQHCEHLAYLVKYTNGYHLYPTTLKQLPINAVLVCYFQEKETSELVCKGISWDGYKVYEKTRILKNGKPTTPWNYVPEEETIISFNEIKLLDLGYTVFVYKYIV